jgi:sugar phosphate isomerase/epimerase
MPEILMKNKRQILNLLKKFNAPPIAHTSWYIELGTIYSGVRDAWIKECKKEIDTTYVLGIKKINFHSHSRGLFNKKAKNVLLDTYVKSMKELVIYAKRYEIKVMIENAAEKGEIKLYPEISYIVKNVPELGFLLDVGHAHINGGMKVIEKYIRKFGDRIEHIHMHDNHGKSDEHLPIGKGKTNYKKVVRLLKKIGYDKTITFEVFTSKNDAKKSMNKIKRLWR